ncbi:MAG: hypothetical protein NT080_10385, partial [Spirochaetes bacterium]|nr:hypothetical protein [Spirochaetota bacterium]
AEAVAGDEDLVAKTMAMDIATANYYELVAWARSVGVSDSGAAAEIRSRLYAFYKLEAPASDAKKGKRIRIESADRTEYFKMEDADEKIIRLSGRVVLSVTMDSSGESHRIEADRIMYNESTGSVSASGRISYVFRKADTTQYFYGEKLAINLDTWQGIFLDGLLERAQSGKDEAVLMEADTIVKGDDGWLVFDDATITTCKEDSPHYSIRASRVWILGPNEWAIANAVLSVGEVPVLYLPFFYYPGQEIVFHPVFGSRDREGRFVQTTTYLLGDKPVKSDSISVFKLVSAGTENAKELKGVFLRQTEEKKKASSPDILKVMADVYSNSGGALVVMAKRESLAVMKAIELYAGFGLSRSVFRTPELIYTPYVLAGGYSSVWNGSTVLGFPFPLRYAFDCSTRIALAKLNLTVKVAFFSDPFWDIDFQNRSEDMDWLRFLRQAESETTISRRTSITQRVDTQYSFPVKAFAPFLSSLELSRLSSSMLWSAKSRTPVPSDPDELDLYEVDPAREFFVPDQFMMIDTSVSAKGELFAWSSDASSGAAKQGSLPGGTTGIQAGSAPRQGEAGTPSGTGVIPPWSVEPGDGTGTESGASPGGFQPPSPAPGLVFEAARPTTSSVGYSLSAQGGYERRFLTASWLESDDIDWRMLYDLASYKFSGGLTGNFGFSGQTFSLATALTYSNQGQGRPYANSDPAYISTALEDSWTLQDAQARTQRLGGSLKASLMPFLDLWLWSRTSLTYSLDARLFASVFREMDGSSPVYETTFPEFTNEGISNHSLEAVLSLQPWGYIQSLSLSSTLPPLDPSYGLKVALKAPWASLTASTKYYKLQESAPFRWDPLSTQAELGTGSPVRLTNAFLYDIERGEPVSDTATLTAGSFVASLVMKQSKDYELIPASGWQVVDASVERFRPTDLAANWKPDWKSDPFWRNRANLKLLADFRFSQSLLRFSESTLSLTTGLTFSVSEALDLNFSSSSQNPSVWRYFPGLFDLPFAVDPVNPIADIIRSFNFFDDGTSRRQSLFKLRSLSFKAVRHLHDWDLSLEFTGNPVLTTNGLDKKYIFDSTITILVAWRPIPEFSTKTTLTAEGIAVE